MSFRLALFLAVLVTVRPAWATDFYYVQRANGDPFFYYSWNVEFFLVSDNWPVSHNWTQLQTTFVDAMGHTIIRAPSNWSARTPEDTIELINYYPGSTQDPYSPEERNIFLDSNTVFSNVSTTINTLSTGPQGSLTLASGTSLTILTGLTIGTDGLVHLSSSSELSLTIGNDIGTGSLHMASGSNLNLNVGTSLTMLRGAVTNHGSINLPNDSGINDGDLRIGGVTTFAGSGRVAVTGPNSLIEGVTADSDELINTDGHIFSGRGHLGNNRLKLTNESLIDANIAGAALIVDPNAAGVTNSSIMQASGGGFLRLQHGTFINTGALIQALDGSQVQLDGATIVGGTLHSEGSGEIVVPGGTFGSLIGTVTNNAVISLPNAPGADGDLKIADGTTLIGSGRVMLGGGPNNDIYGVATGNEELINGATHTISGGGRLGDNLLKLTNNGLVDANLDTGALIVNPSAGGLVNQATGILRASGTAGLQLTDGTFDNQGTVRSARWVERHLHHFGHYGQ